MSNSSIFAAAIEDHLSLKRRNRQLDEHLPLDEFIGDDPFVNHPLFKTEEQARLEETMDGELTFPEDLTLAWPVAEEVVAHREPEEGSALWGRTRDFDWGD